jgi:hypothetical protein
MSRGTHGDGRITRLLAGEPWPPHDGTGDLEEATDGPFVLVRLEAACRLLGIWRHIGVRSSSSSNLWGFLMFLVDWF